MSNTSTEDTSVQTSTPSTKTETQKDENNSAKTNTDTKAKAPKEEKPEKPDKEKQTSAKPEQTKAQKTTTEKPTDKKTGSTGKTGIVIGVLAFIIALGSAGGAYWIWQQLQLSQQQLQTDIASSNTNQQQLQQKLADLNNSLQQADQKIAAQQQSNNEKLNAFQTNLTNLYTRIGNTERDWVVAEAAYLLQIANHRLQLAQDVKTTLSALNLADQRLRSIGDPALLEVRNLIAKERTALENLSIPDRAGLALSISQLAANIDQLPLAVRVQPIADQVPELKPDDALQVNQWQALPSAIWEATKELITIRYNERPTDALLPPQQVQYLHQNLQIKLEQARLASIQQDTAIYQESLQRAKSWMESYFDTSDPAVDKVVNKIGELANQPVSTTMPDISGSLRKLKEIANRLAFDLKSETAPAEDNAKKANANSDTKTPAESKP